MRNFAWTTDPERAEWFARRFGRFADGSDSFRPVFVYETDAPPHSLLCIPGDEGRENEAEYVIDPRGLKVRRIAGPFAGDAS
jgi:hypothetical protein